MDQANLLEVFIVTPREILFEGKAHSVVLPGEMGIFEVMINHKPLFTRLLAGEVIVDEERSIPIRRGVAKVMSNRILAVVEGVSQ